MMVAIMMIVIQKVKKVQKTNDGVSGFWCCCVDFLCFLYFFCCFCKVFEPTAQVFQLQSFKSGRVLKLSRCANT